jgi:hypothetical protein
MITYFPYESLIDFYGTLLASAIDNLDNLYLCTWDGWIEGEKRNLEKYDCIPISRDEYELVKSDITPNDYGGQEGNYIKQLKKSRESESFILILKDGELYKDVWKTSNRLSGHTR